MQLQQKILDGLILRPQILKKDDIYTLDFHEFHSKVTLFLAFFSISEICTLNSEILKRALYG